MQRRRGAGRLAFGPFEIDLGTGELRKHATLVKLQPQPFRVLALLASYSGELVTRETIRDELWGDGTNVDFDAGLNFCIRQIRSALVDDAVQPRYIETLAKRGYRFLAPVTTVEPASASPQTPLLAETTPQIAQPQSSAPSVLRSGWQVIGLVAGAMLLVGIGWKILTTDPSNRILVRPFVTVGLSEDESWFGDALAQQLAGALVETKKVRVAPWSLSLALKKDPPTTREIARRFLVNRILEGTVTRVGGRLVVSTQLVDAATGRALWTHHDERDAPNLAGLQDDISNALAAELKLEVAADNVPKTRRRPQDAETYNLYLRALYLSGDFGPPVQKSIAYFQEVIRRAPDYAPAYAGLASAFVIKDIGPSQPRMESLAQAESYARKAVEMDPGLADAHCALGHFLWQGWHWKAAEAEFREALKLDPDLAEAHHLYGLCLVSQGRSVQAIREERKAVELAPTSALISEGLTNVLFYAGRIDEAIAQGRLTVELFPHFSWTYDILARAYTLKGKTAEAQDALRQEEQAGVPGPPRLLWMANTLARMGQREHARAAIQQWREIQAGLPPPLGVAVALDASGDTAGALDAIDQSVAAHTLSMIWLKASPELANLHSHPRFKQALARMGLD